MDPRHLQRRQAAKVRLAERRSLLDPTFNLRECSKQLLLLEDHLFQANKRCPDCIRKHLMTVEALAEEAVTLDLEGRWAQPCEDLAEFAKSCLEFLSDNFQREDSDQDKDLRGLAQEIRKVRKSLVGTFHDPRSPETRVASAYMFRLR